MHNGLHSNGGKVSRKRLGQRRRQGVTEKVWAATEARWYGKGLGSNGGKVSRKGLGQQRRQGVTEKACLSYFAHFRCRCRFLRMSQLACSFLLIRVECLSYFAHFRCRCRSLRMSQLPCSSSSSLCRLAEGVLHWFRLMSQLPCSFW